MPRRCGKRKTRSRLAKGVPPSLLAAGYRQTSRGVPTRTTQSMELCHLHGDSFRAGRDYSPLETSSVPKLGGTGAGCGGAGGAGGGGEGSEPPCCDWPLSPASSGVIALLFCLVRRCRFRTVLAAARVWAAGRGALARRALHRQEQRLSGRRRVSRAMPCRHSRWRRPRDPSPRLRDGVATQAAAAAGSGGVCRFSLLPSRSKLVDT
jgi:hypothetical protein